MKIAVCGLGRMGTAFAEVLAADGHELTGWNRTARQIPGVRPTGTPAQAAAEADAVVVMVFDGPAAEAVLLGPDGVTTGARRGTLVVNTTTLSPDESRRLAGAVIAEGLRYVEAPVIGSVPAVRARALTTLVGGTPEAARAAEPVLRSWSQAGAVRHVGPVGAATGLKLVANLGLGLALAALHEVVGLGAGFGLAREEVLDVVQGGVFGRLVEGKRARLSQDSYGEADFTLDGMVKDMTLATSATDARLPVAEAAARLIERVARRDGGLDVAVMGASHTV
ncbi:NAD(P)-dependent oxidoreductase [Nonomuraea longicatena]|uniref:NAD(P)-dependent oxidoreductase n=1 Tax=Nonomuraea longicatena TaxID=83682 RepID=A0ABP4A4T0_9ACTN